MTQTPDLDVWANRNAHGGEAFLVTDRFRRLRMSSGLIAMLNCRNIPYKAYLAYDKANKRIALGNPDIVTPTDAKTVTFDAGRHYANARGFFDKHGIPTEKVRYVYDGKWNGWLMFRCEDWDAEDGRGN
jgi:hypothetical protein